MATDADVIKEFLVSLGFKIDQRGQNAFVNGVTDATKTVTALGVATAAAATAVVAGVAKITESLEQLYFASQRNKASVETIQALDFAARQFGAGAREAVESLGRFIRSSPGSESFLRGLGVQTRTANGALKDTSDILTGLGERLRQMPYYRAKAYADFLGIDERTLQALQQGLGRFSDEYRAMARAAGLDSDRAARASHGFMVELRRLGAAFDILAKRTGSDLARGLSDEIRRFRQWIVSNFDLINDAIVKVVDLLVRIGDIFVTIVRRIGQGIRAVIDWFQNLSEETKNVLKALVAIRIAWVAFNSAFLATPIGRILALASALALLVDDYLVWKEGGKSLIDWGKWSGEIDKAIDGITRLANVIERIWKRVEPILDRFAKGMGFGDFGKYVQSSVEEANDLYNLGDALLSGDGQRAKQVLEDRKARRRGGQTPRGIRNNNPGNLNFVGQAGATREEGPNGRFAKFKTPKEGLEALANQLRLYGARGLDTVREVVTTYAPSSENDTKAYIEQLARFMGIDPDEKFDVKSDPAALAMLMKGIIKHENGFNPYSGEQINAAAGVAPSPAAGAQISQKTDIYIHGVSDAQQAGQAVAREQQSVNERLVRNLRGAVQ